GSSDDQGAVAQFSIRSKERVRSVLDGLEWENYEVLGSQDKRQYISDLRDVLRVNTPSMPKGAYQQLVEISFKSDSGDRAYEFVTQLFRSWKSEVLDSQKNQARNERDEIKKLLDDQRRELALKAQEIEDERTKWNIPPPRARGEGGYELSISPIFSEAEQLTQRILELEDAIDQARSAVERKRMAWARMPLEAPVGERPQTPAQQGIARVKEEIAALELQQRTSGLHPRHSTYRRREKKIEELRGVLEELQADSSAAGLEPDAMVENVARLALWERILQDEDAIKQLEVDLTRIKERESDAKGRAFQLNVAYSKIEQLISEVRELEARISVQAQKYDEAKRLVSKLSDSEGGNFEVLEQAEVPLEPTDPNPWIIAIGSIIASLALGLGIGVIKEYGKTVFRSPREIARILPHPVLGRVNTIRTRRERIRSFLVQVTLASASSAFLVSVVYVTWAYGANGGKGLTRPMIDAIERFREMIS
ncbi:MAG: hypothetical protein VX460_02375, partial [Planctomycetota bacterium]|nr:hypothetical protein [Planctomycetota bacterium]